jgi:hypothetical protein
VDRESDVKATRAAQAENTFRTGAAGDRQEVDEEDEREKTDQAQVTKKKKSEEDL